MILNKKFRRALLKRFPLHYYRHYNSYSQEGEDLIIKTYFEGNPKYKGFYVDIGAYHPIRFSNTYLLYKKGWKGINIDPTPDSMKIFKLLRKRDINLEFGVGSEKKEMNFYCFNEPALNSFSEKLAKERDGLKNYKIIKTVKVPVFTLEEVLNQYLPDQQSIDLLNIDVEGLDFEVLQSNNWHKFRPKLIVIEEKIDIGNLSQSKIVTYLKGNGYCLSAKTFRTLFFSKIDSTE